MLAKYHVVSYDFPFIYNSINLCEPSRNRGGKICCVFWYACLCNSENFCPYVLFVIHTHTCATPTQWQQIAPNSFWLKRCEEHIRSSGCMWTESQHKANMLCNEWNMTEYVLKRNIFSRYSALHVNVNTHIHTHTQPLVHAALCHTLHFDSRLLSSTNGSAILHMNIDSADGWVDSNVFFLNLTPSRRK